MSLMRGSACHQFRALYTRKETESDEYQMPFRDEDDKDAIKRDQAEDEKENVFDSVPSAETI